MKRGRTAPKSRRSTKSARTATRIFPTQNRNQTFFVQRSFGNPRAITERKYFDTQGALTLIGSTTSWAGAELDPAALCLFSPVQGDDFDDRQGRKVTVLSIKLSGQVVVPPQANQTATDQPALIRMHLVQDKQTNAAQLNAEDVFASGTATDPTNQFQNPAFFGRFRILKTKKFVLANPNMAFDGTNVEQNALVRQFKMNIKFKKPVVVHYNGTNGGTVADVIDHSFHLIGLTSSTDMGPILGYKVRTTYLDK